MALFQDSRGEIWAGSYLGGLSRYDSASKCFRPVHMPQHDGEAAITSVNTIAEGPDGRLWLGTNGSGVCIYDPSTNICKHLIYSQLGG